MRPADDISARILMAIRDFARTKLGAEEAELLFAEAARSAGLDVAHATHPRAWVSVSAFQAIAAAYVPALGEDVVADAITWAIPMRRDHSAMSLTALATPDLFYRHLDHARAYFAKHLHFEVFPATPGSLRIPLHYRHDVPRERSSCAVARGVLMGVPLLFDLPPAEVEEHACWARGAPCCSYEIRYRAIAPYHLLGAALGAVAGAIGAMLLPTMVWLFAPITGWLVGREIHGARLRGLMTRVSEEHRRVIAENEREAEKRYEEMRVLNESLEQRVAERTADMQMAMRELRERNVALRSMIDEMKKLRGELVDAGSERIDGVRPASLDDALRELEHEIRNPMTYVLANLEHLEHEQPHRQDLGELAEVVTDIRAGVDAVRSVVAWFIGLYRPNTEARPIRYDLARELPRTVSYLTRRWDDRVTIKVDARQAVVASRGPQLAQVFANLIQNAGDAVVEGMVWVTAEEVNGRVIVRVRDEGPGISETNLPRVFERGFTTKSERGGAGLGLHIARQIVESHGGTIAVTSKVGEGCIFEVDLPAWRSSDPPARHPSPPPRL